ncbi:hypothetical protein QTI66_13310 [Variovorax sp. J22R133]|uniref:hypothetical protein n=1 Tax=Variovorax brevis TaxID=3053503 RepID=UPI002575E04C|nr:hypothetical protein [Variovorax sp. J22R133]MDM0113131.1 hypothetical protein [Variovorax sp. J22R133]
MHTVIVMAGGLALMAACLLLGYAWGQMRGLLMGAQFFIPLWLVGAFVNMWIGVSSAGYSWAEEFPIFLAIFALPAAVAAGLWWKLS